MDYLFNYITLFSIDSEMLVIFRIVCSHLEQASFFIEFVTMLLISNCVSSFLVCGRLFKLSWTRSTYALISTRLFSVLVLFSFWRCFLNRPDFFWVFICINNATWFFSIINVHLFFRVNDGHLFFWVINGHLFFGVISVYFWNWRLVSRLNCIINFLETALTNGTWLIFTNCGVRAFI